MGAAQQLAAKGFFVFPLAKNSKRPIKGLAWKEESSADPKVIEAWEKQYPGSNWGIDCEASNLAVIDVDCKDKDGFASLKDLPDLPPTMVFSTPTGGEHLIYRGDIKSTASQLGPGLDTRGRGGYIVAPGSKLKDKRYRVKTNRELAEIPPWVAARLTPTKVPPASTEADIAWDSPASLVEAEKFLLRAPAALEGQGGDAQTFKVAARLRDYGISTAVALPMLLDYWNPRCEPPWSPEELAIKVNNAYTYAQNKPGTQAPEAAFADAPPVARTDVYPLNIQPFDKLLAPPPDRRWLIRDWIPAEEMILLTGRGGRGKSLLALQLAISASYGVPWMGLEPEERMETIYISCEDDEGELQRRGNDITRLPQYSFLNIDDPTRFQHVSMVGEDATMVRAEDWKLVKGTLYDRLRATLARLQWKNPLIILDTLSDMYLANENARAQVTQFVKQYLGTFKKEYHATIICIAHPPKNTESTFSGSTAWEGSFRTLLAVEAYPSEKMPSKTLTDHRVIRLTKSNRTSLRGKQIVIEYRNGGFIPADTGGLDSVEAVKATDDLQAVYDMVCKFANNPDTDRLSIAPQAANYIGRPHVQIRDTFGTVMTSQAKLEYLRMLESLGRVRIMSGQRDRNQNGIFPLEEEEATK